MIVPVRAIQQWVARRRFCGLSAGRRRRTRRYDAGVALIYCGIDEAGYGPLLGPLCVGFAAFRVEDWAEGDEAPDLWKRLSAAVCREPGDKRRRVAVDDSKKLKLANSSVTKHPLHHLERGVLAFMGCLDCGDAATATLPASDDEFMRAIGVSLAPECWYSRDGCGAAERGAYPQGSSVDELAIAANTVKLALARAGIGVMRLQAAAVSESAFNELVEAAGTKAAVTESALVRFLGEVWERDAAVAEGGTDGVRVVCDRQGGRTQYSGMLARALPDARVRIVGETPMQSKYELESVVGARRKMSVAFKVEAESAHLPVALASMIAKLTREVLMARFNRYWCRRIPELKPTAGYAMDARRWLRDVHEAISPAERRVLVRRA